MNGREIRFIVAILVLENFWACFSAVETPQSKEVQAAQQSDTISKATANIKSFLKGSAKLSHQNPDKTEKVVSIDQDPSDKPQSTSSSVYENKLDQIEDEKASIKQVIEQFEEFKKASRQRALDYIKNFEEKALKPLEFLTPDNETPTKSEISASEKKGKQSISLNHNKIDPSKFSLKPEFPKIEELTIKTSEEGLEPVKLNSLNFAKQFDRDLERPLLKRGVDDSWKKGSSKITRARERSKGVPKIQKSRKIPHSTLVNENRDVKNSIFKIAGTPSVGFAKFPQDKKTPLLKRDTEDLEKNRIPKVARTFDRAPEKIPAVKLTEKFGQNRADHQNGNTLADVRGPFLKPVLNNEIPKISKNETVKTGFNRKMTPLNMVYNLDAECVAFPSERTRTKFLERGQFVPKNLMINRIQFSGDKAYVTMPKLKRGVPFSVGKVGLAGGPKGDLRIEAFPNWAIHRYANISGIVNAVDIFAEEGTLWILDSGVVWTLESPERLAPAKVFAVDLVKEQVIKAIDLSNFVDKTSRLQHIVVETGPYNCRFVYISDAASRSLIIWDVCNDFGSKIVLPKSTQPEVAAQPDILYLNLIARGKTDLLAVTFLSADNLFGIPTYSLQNLKFGTMTGDVTNLGLKPGRVVVLGADRKWMYFRFVASGDIFAWDAGTDFKEENFRKLRAGNGDEFATQVTMGHKRLVWALESNFQDYGKQGEESGLVFSIRAICKSSDLQIV